MKVRIREIVSIAYDAIVYFTSVFEFSIRKDLDYEKCFFFLREE